MSTLKAPPRKSLIVVLSEYCKNDPPPIFCELPDELKIKTISFSGVSNVYTTVTSGTSGATTSTTAT